MSDLTKLIAPGSAVVLVPANVQGTVLGVALYGEGHIQYLVAHWDGGKRQADWVDAAEIVAHGDAVGTRTIGW